VSTWTHIRTLPTSVTEVPRECSGVHESCLRSYQILEKVKEYLVRGVPADVILELVVEAEGKDEP